MKYIICYFINTGKQKKRNEEVCSSTKIISEQERRKFLRLFPNKPMLSLCRVQSRFNELKNLGPQNE